MKLISFFSRFTFICNICFLVFILFNRLDAKKSLIGSNNTVLRIPFFKDLIIILGFSAIIINLLMCVVYLVAAASGKFFLLPKWLVTINFIFLFIEFYFFFF